MIIDNGKGEKNSVDQKNSVFVFLFNFFYVPVLSNYSRFSAYRINVNRIAHSVHSEKNNQKC